MSSALTDEQRERIAKNKEEALRRRDARLEREKAELASHAQNSHFAKPSASNEIAVISSTGPHTLKGSHQPLSNVQKSHVTSDPKPYATCSSAASTSNSILQPKSLLQPSNRDNFPLFNKNKQFPKSSDAFNPKPAPRPPAMAQVPKSNVKVTFSLISPEKVKVAFSPFHQAIVNALKTLKTRYYNEQERTWSIALEDVKQAETALKAVKECDVKVESVPDKIVGMLHFRPEAVPDDLSKVIDAELISRLFPYQKGGVKFAISRGGRAMIADEMGLGKSLQALTAARYYKSEWPLLIVCPSSVKSAWKHQIQTFLPYITKITIIEKKSEPLPEARTSNTVVIMSYELMVLKQKELEEKSYFVIILDESHMLKDGKAKRTKTAQVITKKASRVLLLSGTPALSRPIELFSQIKLVNSHLFPSYKDFAIRYCDGKDGRFSFEAKGCTNSEELTAILLKRVMIRRLKNDVLTDLPDKRREVVYLSGSSIDYRMESLQRARAAFEASNNSGMPTQGNERLLEYFSATGIVKAAAVCEHILDNYFHADVEPRKVLIFGHHQIVLDTIQVEVHKRNLRSIRIDGSTPSKERGVLCDLFQTDPNVLVAILSMTAAGVGITLTAASVVVFAELHWNPGTLMQAEDRAHRVGQKDSVFVQYLVARNTADDQIWPLLQTKLDILGQVKLSSDSYRDADSTHMNCGTPQTKRRKIGVVLEEG